MIMVNIPIILIGMGVIFAMMSLGPARGGR
jgi:hypothetical protein